MWDEIGVQKIRGETRMKPGLTFDSIFQLQRYHCDYFLSARTANPYL